MDGAFCWYCCENSCPTFMALSLFDLSYGSVVKTLTVKNSMVEYLLKEREEQEQRHQQELQRMQEMLTSARAEISEWIRWVECLSVCFFRTGGILSARCHFVVHVEGLKSFHRSSSSQTGLVRTKVVVSQVARGEGRERERESRRVDPTLSVQNVMLPSSMYTTTLCCIMRH